MQITMRKLSSILFFCSGLLAGCAQFGASSSDAYWIKADAKKSAMTPVESALAYYAYVHPLTGVEWVRENESLKEAVGKSAAEFDRLRQILLLIAPAAPARERLRAPQLLAVLEKDAQKSGSAFLPLIQLLRTELDERRRLEDKLRDESRKSDDLEQKLEALKAIEKNLSERRRIPQGVNKP